MKKPTQEAAAHSRDNKAQITPVHVRLDAMVEKSAGGSHSLSANRSDTSSCCEESCTVHLNTSTFHLRRDARFLSEERRQMEAEP